MLEIEQYTEQINVICRANGVKRLVLFGSALTDAFDSQSDVDFLVEFEESATLMDHAALLLELQELLGRRVDVAPEKCLRPRIRERVLAEAIPL